MEGDPLETEILVDDEAYALALVKQFNLGRGRTDLNHHTRITGVDGDYFYATSGTWDYIIDRRTELVEVA